MTELVRIPYIVTEGAIGRPDLDRAHPDDAGVDLYACESGSLEPGTRAIINTGIAMAIPEGYAGLVMPRSGLAAKYGITVLNSPGLIDAGYRGDIGVVLHNTDRTLPFNYFIGDRIAQLVIVQLPTVRFDHMAWLPHSERADAGFGSTGR